MVAGEGGRGGNLDPVAAQSATNTASLPPPPAMGSQDLSNL